MKKNLPLGMALLLLACSWSVHAVPLNLSISGTVQAVDQNNVYGLSVGDTILATAMFDDALVSNSGLSFAELGSSGNAFGAMLSFTVGGVNFGANEDASYQFPNNLFPLLVFFDGDFDGFEFIADAGTNGAAADFDVFGFSFGGQDGLLGAFNTNSLQIAPKPVPEPLTVLLVILAIVALRFQGMNGYGRSPRSVPHC